MTRLNCVVISLGACLLGPLLAAVAPEPAPTRVYIDSDTANEGDDPYAIVRALVAPELEVVGLSSISWKTAGDFAGGTRHSQKMNEEILALTGLADRVRHPLGALARMPDESTAVDSPAARDIIARARETPAGRKLRVFVLGAFTNVASAMLLDPAIKGRVAVYAMGYNVRDGRLTTDEFNCEGDPNAAAYLLASGVELHVMPASVLHEFHWAKAEVDAHFKGAGGVREYLVRRWESYAPGEARRILWDVAIFEAYLHPRLTASRTVVQDGSTVHVWTAVDAARMRDDYWRATKKQK